MLLELHQSFLSAFLPEQVGLKAHHCQLSPVTSDLQPLLGHFALHADVDVVDAVLGQQF